ncbi:hypothetical protein PI124_g648 [Phytophthora idaei]|nr:hypothetical protein PI124_g648 [Phytophthora idaei]
MALMLNPQTTMEGEEEGEAEGEAEGEMEGEMEGEENDQSANLRCEE